ncbi:MAG: hypothetical protein NZ827_03500 [Aquificaceae bacterium]|nr:hypothetical protein [Aquificaceae bacterium]
MEYVLLLVVVLFLIWKINLANKEAFPQNNERKAEDKPFQEDSPMHCYEGTSQSNVFSSEEKHKAGSSSSLLEDGISGWSDDCNLSRALWDPSCPLYHSLHEEGLSGNDDWSSSSWDTYSYYDSWTSSGSGWDS